MRLKSSIPAAVAVLLLMAIVALIRGIDVGLHVAPYAIVGAIVGDVSGRLMFRSKKP